MRLEQQKIKELCDTAILENWKASSDVFPDFFVPLAAGMQQKNEQWLDEIQQEAKSIGKSRRKGEALMLRFLTEEPILGARVLGMDTLQDFLKEMKSFHAQCLKFDASITKEALLQAFRNYSVYAVFLIMNGMPQHCHRAIAAYSLLYPYTDNVLDNSAYTTEQKKDMNHLIYARLNGRPALAAALEERKAAQLLDMLAEVYPYHSHPTLYDSLLLIYDAQLESQRQQNASLTLSAQEALCISAYKGGTSVLADRCLMPEPLREEEVAFYLGLGFFLQLCDDLQDVEEDMASHSRTLFTCAADAGERSLYVNRMFHYLERLFTEHASLFTGSETSIDFLRKNCHTLILSTVLSIPQYFHKDYVNRIERYFPVSAPYLDKQSLYMRSTLLPMILSMSDLPNPLP